jgi:glyoxylase-like metal-dependent hydrolase (beta-lactamase superfamily II)
MSVARLVLALIASFALALPAAAAKAPPKGLKLYAIDCGHFDIADGDMFSDDGAYKGKPQKLVVPCFLIRHPKGDLVWDTGVPSDKLTTALGQLGLKPSDIKYVSVSHGHGDHIGNAGLFASATWIVDPRERDWVFRPDARKDAASFSRYSALETSKQVLVDGDKPYDVYGDGSVMIYRTPGHTPGHTILLINLPKAGPVILAGDMWHIAESREARRVPRFNFNREQTLASMDKVEKLAADTHAKVIREHVIADFDTLPVFPKPLE